MKDFIKQELSEGDYIAFIRPNYRELILGKVVRVNAKLLRVAYIDQYNCRDETNVHPNNAIKIQSPDVVNLILTGAQQNI